MTSERRLPSKPNRANGRWAESARQELTIVSAMSEKEKKQHHIKPTWVAYMVEIATKGEAPTKLDLTTESPEQTEQSPPETED